ncbi:MAG: patatin-like phospholipase family protein [Pseudomonadota bacterium]
MPALHGDRGPFDEQDVKASSHPGFLDELIDADDPGAPASLADTRGMHRSNRPKVKTRYFDPKRIGLSMSGGGYRATLFHAGVVIRLNEWGLLGHIDRISSVSGGSITAGILATGWSKLTFDTSGVATNLKEHFTDRIIAATQLNIDVRTGLAGFVPFVSAGNFLAGVYDKRIFGQTLLRDLPVRPKFIFNASNLQTGGLFRFTRDYLADWRALYITNHYHTVGEAVAASSAFPTVLSPVRLDIAGTDETDPDRVRFHDPVLREKAVLVDGGVYDNLGLEAIWKHCGIVIASYSGWNYGADTTRFARIDRQTLAVVNSFLASSIDWRERMLIKLFQNWLPDDLPERTGAYWTAETDIDNFDVSFGWRPDPGVYEKARNSPTRLKSLWREEQIPVIHAGYAYADAAIRCYLLPGLPASSGAPEIF